MKKGSYAEFEGDLFALARDGWFDVITHGCNCFCTMGSGIAVPMKNTYGVDKYPMESHRYKGDINKLGTIDFKFHEDHRLFVVNSYTQFDYNRNKDPEAVHVNYEAVGMCMAKINHTFKGKRVGIPMIGAGRAGGDWEKVKSMIQKYLTDVDVTVIKYKR